jgi:cysteine synthase
MIDFFYCMSHLTHVYEDIFELLPSEENPTPMVRIRQLNPAPDFKLYAKLEWYNPFGSVKDRAAWGVLRRLEKEGKVGHGHNLVEATSGNTGLSLAAMASARGYKLRAIVPGRIPGEKKTLLKIAGADLEVLNDDVCPAPGLAERSINRAKSHAKASPNELNKIYVQEKGVDPAKASIAYCRIGERSSHTWFVLKYLLGIADVKNYDGSWTEYGNLIGAPIDNPSGGCSGTK